MPYKDQGPWFVHYRAYMAEIRPTIGTKSAKIYEWRLNACGEVLGYPNPRTIALPTLRALEQKLPGNETNRGILARALKSFLTWVGNRDAKRWKIQLRSRPKVGGVFLSEEETARGRAAARSLGPLYHLLYSLGIDNGLRCVDMQNLTMSNARELMGYAQTDILGKGRNGGKLGHLELSKMTEEPLREYLAYRREIVKRWGRDWEELIIIERTAAPPHAGPPSYSFLKRAIQAISKLSGIKFNPHDLRRSYGHRLHLAGVKLETIAWLMRHESIDDAFRSYIGILRDEMREAQDRLARNP